MLLIASYLRINLHGHEAYKWRILRYFDDYPLLINLQNQRINCNY